MQGIKIGWFFLKIVEANLLLFGGILTRYFLHLQYFFLGNLQTTKWVAYAMPYFKGTLCENLSSLYFGFLELGGGPAHVCWEICAGAPGGLPRLVRSPVKVRKKNRGYSLHAGRIYARVSRILNLDFFCILFDAHLVYQIWIMKIWLVCSYAFKYFSLPALRWILIWLDAFDIWLIGLSC